MKINVKQKDCRFYVDENARKVVCVIPRTRDMVLDYIDDFPVQWCMRGKKAKELLLPSSFTGVATCHPNDEFNVETGKLIAFHKAKHKLCTSFFKRANKFVNYVDEELNKAMDSFNDFGDRLSEAANARENEIQKRLGV